MSKKYESGGEDSSEWQTTGSKKGGINSWYEDDSQSRQKRDKQPRKEESDENVHDSQTIPDAVKQYLTNFHKLLSSQPENDEYRVDELFSFYDNQFNKLSECFYQIVPWPAANLVAPFVDHGILSRHNFSYIS